LFTNSAID